MVDYEDNENLRKDIYNLKKNMKNWWTIELLLNYRTILYEMIQLRVITILIFILDVSENWCWLQIVVTKM